MVLPPSIYAQLGYIYIASLWPGGFRTSHSVSDGSVMFRENSGCVRFNEVEWAYNFTFYHIDEYF